MSTLPARAYTPRDAYVAAIAGPGPDAGRVGLWHRIADPDEPHGLRRTACGQELRGLAIVTPWLPPTGEAQCPECRR